MLGDKCCQFSLSLEWTLGKLLELPQACSVQGQDSYSHTEIRVGKGRGNHIIKSFCKISIFHQENHVPRKLMLSH